MPQVRYTAFHVDFSTLDIERGQVRLQPSQFACVVLPQAMPVHITVPADDEKEGAAITGTERIPSARRAKVSRSRRIGMKGQKSSS